jgi:IS5 family transposase
MAALKVSRCSDVDRLAAVLDLPAVQGLIAELQETRWTGRPGYPIRSMVGLMITKSLFALPTWTRTVRLVQDHEALREILDCLHDENMPSIDAVYRFSKKLLAHSNTLDACIAQVLASLQEAHPRMGLAIAIDASDMPAYANGQKTLWKNGPERKRFSDPDASWGHRSAVSTRSSGSYYGFKLHAAVCTDTELPVAWYVEAAKSDERKMAVSLLDLASERGFNVETMAADRGYDARGVYEACEERDIRPIIPLSQSAGVKAGRHLPPSCEHGTWIFRGTDYQRKEAKWACPTGECKPATKWVRADRLHPLVPRETDRWKKLYSQRSAIEREFGRLKHEHGLLPLRVRGLDRVRLHVNLTILTQLGAALAQARTLA